MKSQCITVKSISPKQTTHKTVQKAGTTHRSESVTAYNTKNIGELI